MLGTSSSVVWIGEEGGSMQVNINKTDCTYSVQSCTRVQYGVTV